MELSPFQNFTRKGSALSETPFSNKEEKKLLDTLGKVLASDFPNPGRVGCPSQEILHSVASKKLSLKQAEPWIEHIGHCSPCYSELTSMRLEVQRRRRYRYLTVAAVIVIAVAISVWAAVYRRNRRPVKRSAAVLDMRDQFLLRGDTQPERNRAKTPLSLSRGIVDATIYLIFGSQPGTYDVEVADESGTPLVVATGTAAFVDHVVELHVTLDVSRLNAGHYLLGIRQPGSAFQFGQLIIR